jgi:hypothetical protein
MELILDLRENLPMQIRPNSCGSEYLEAVIGRKELGLLDSLLVKHLGPPAKVPGIEVDLPAGVQKLIDDIGGLRTDQSFFYKQEANRVFFAVLWPWGSNPEKTTLKAGIRFLNIG